MKNVTPQRRALPWMRLVLLGIWTTAVIACRPSRTVGGNTPEATPRIAEEKLRDRLNPVHQPPSLRATAFVAPPPWNPATIFPAPVRTWLPPAETPEKPAVLFVEQRIAATPPNSLRENPLLAPIASPPASLPFLPRRSHTPPRQIRRASRCGSRPVLRPKRGAAPELGSPATRQRSYRRTFARVRALRSIRPAGDSARISSPEHSRSLRANRHRRTSQSAAGK